MLTAQDFDCQVTMTSINGVDCWRYLGNDLEECIQVARLAQSKGEKFYDPLLDEVQGVHQAKLDRGMVLLLAAMDHYHRFNACKTLTYPNDFPVVSPKAARGFTTNYSYLVHFRLLAKKTVDGEVQYWVTERGRRFLQGEEILCELYNIGPEVVGYNPDSQGTIGKFFHDGMLEQMKKPLWFLPERHRQDILTTEELAIG